MTPRSRLFLGLIVGLVATAAVAGWTLVLTGHHSARTSDVRVSERVLKLEPRTLRFTTTFGATLGYLPAPVKALDPAGGIVTGLPALDSVITQGQTLFQIDGAPVILLYGQVPEWRSLSAGVPSGADVKELEQNLDQLGYSGGYALPLDGVYSNAVGVAVERLLEAKGLPPSTDLNLGTVLYAPGPVLVAGLPVTLGATVGPTTAVVNITTTQRAVTGTVSPRAGPEVSVGQPATVTPDRGGPALTGVVAQVSPSHSQSSGQLNVTIALSNTANLPTGDLPVQATVTTQELHDVLAVPVQALVALVDGGYALEVRTRGGREHLIPVHVGASASDGFTQIGGPAVRAGLAVLVPTLY